MAERIVFAELAGGLIRPDRLSGVDPLDSVRLQSGCLPALTRFADAGYSIVLLDDRPPPTDAGATGVESGLSSFVTSLLESQGIAVAALERCAHPAGAGCDCALPGIGLVADYIAGDRLDRPRSIVVGSGDRISALARAMGVAGFAADGEADWRDIAHTVLDRPRCAIVTRKTRETDIEVEVDLDRAQEPEIETGIGFFDHMLEQLGKHGGFALRIRCSGDLEIDEHHTVEDVALALGQALREASTLR